MLDLGNIYDNLDKMAELKRYKPPTQGYFPSVAEINTYAKSKDFPYILEYLLWLDDNLSMAERENHKVAVARLREIVDELENEDDEEDEEVDEFVDEWEEEESWDEN